MKRFFTTIIIPAMFVFVSLAATGCSDDDGDGKAAALAVPENVKLELRSSTSLTFSWSAVGGAEGYSYKLIESDGLTIAQGSTKETSVEFTNLAAGVDYRFSVGAYASDYNDHIAYSETVSATTGENTIPDPGNKLGLPDWENDDLVRAFPGAEGGGMYTTGGRGGKVVRVTKLTDDGSEGTLRHAINQSGARTVVFDVDGIIELQSTLEIKNGDITIAGQTAPGDGICLKNYSLVVKANNVIIRFIRSRMGDDTDNVDDAMWGRELKNVIIDHCSMSWSTDECSSFYASENFTMQWCVISESLRNSSHGKGTHGYGAIWGGVNASYHHNLLAHHDSRNPRFDGADVYKPYKADAMLHTDDRAVDFRNCVVYNFSNYPAYGGELQKINFEGNYYKWGPGSANGPGPNSDGVAQNAKRRYYFYAIGGMKESVDYGCPSLYVGNKTNYLSTDNQTTDGAVNADNWQGMVYSDSKGSTEYVKLTAAVPIKPDGVSARVTYHDAATAFDRVLEYAGASFRRDAVDTRVVNDTKTGTASQMAGSNGSLNGYVDSPSDVGGWPTYAAGTVKTDSDRDGIPDDWEDEFGLNKNLAADGNHKSLDARGRYTNLEMYHHWLVKEIINKQAENGTYITQ